jgi:undecaprenyl-phosphate 4-deoxy-4-formamido-L-arabinose transferase
MAIHDHNRSLWGREMCCSFIGRACGTPILANYTSVMEENHPVESVSIVIPVYKGEATLPPLVDEIATLASPTQTPHGNCFRVAEVVLVHDGAVDDSQRVLESLGQRYSFVRLVWLARNFGQHPATLAGAACTTSEWVVTLDEDGDHDPADIGRFLDKAREAGAQLVYGLPTNPPSHGWLRNLSSAVTKRVFVPLLLGNSAVGRFHSFRLINGEIARSLAAYCGYNVYLDVALSWVVARSTHCPIVLRCGTERASGYNVRRLFSHFWRLVLTSGTRPLRFVSLLGLAAMLFGVSFSGYTLWYYVTGNVPIQGYTTLAILLCLFSGATLFSLGIVAEYLGASLSVAMGRPLYMIVSRPLGSRVFPAKR